MEDCIKLLKGERDEQRLAGLLLASKLCNNNDHASILRVYDAVGGTFLDRLLRTGMGKGGVRESGDRNQDAYLQLAVTILSSFCRVAEIASSRDMVSKIPLILEVMSKEIELSLLEECLEFLFLVSTAHEDGVRLVYESQGMKILSSQMPISPDGSHGVRLSMRLFELIICKISLETINSECLSELSAVAVAVARQFAISHNELKFEALHILAAILSSTYSAPLRAALRSLLNESWSTHVRVGVVAILTNRLAPEQKLEALILAESVMSIVGEGWVMGEISLPDSQDLVTPDRCVLLVLELSRVEIAVLLNDLAYLKYEKSIDLSSNEETILLKQRNLGIAFSLVEKIIKLISSVGGGGSCHLDEGTITKIIYGLNETTSAVLEYLCDAKDHGIHTGSDLLASVRLIGSYLAEAPIACKEKVEELLQYMLSVQGEHEPSPFSSICFLLPMLCQITMGTDGCRVVASSGAYKAVVECLITLIKLDGGVIEDDGTIFLACDTILNFLLKREQTGITLDDSSFIKLLGALLIWADNADDVSNVMMTSSICALILDSTSEVDLLRHRHFVGSNLDTLSRLIRKSLVIGSQSQDMSEDAENVEDLHQIVVAGYSRWADRYPHVKESVER